MIEFLRVTVFTCILSHAVLLDTVSAQSHANWPGWLGPNRDGWVSYFQPPARWPEKLSKVWAVDVGVGYGSPVVADGLVFQHARQGETEVLWCLDLGTGQVQWQQRYSVPFTMGGGGERHGKGPKSSPIWAEGRVFTMSITGDLSAWDAASGELLWRTDYGSKFEKNQPYWGVATSPIVDGEHVIAHFGNDELGALVALDARTGEEAWSLGQDGPSYSSPLVAEIQGVRQVVEWNHRALVGVDRETGRLLWEFPFPHTGSNQNMPTPVIHQGRVLLGGENRGIHGLEPILKDDGTWSVEPLWHQTAVALDMSTAVINANMLFGFSQYGSGRLFCLNPENGEVVWQGPPRAGENAMLLAVPNHVIGLLAGGELQVFAASSVKHQPVAAYRVADAETWAPLVVLHDGFLVKDLHTLTRWRLEQE
jgi:outer membrane protein assembly factor BamB